MDERWLFGQELAIQVLLDHVIIENVVDYTQMFWLEVAAQEVFSCAS